MIEGRIVAGARDLGSGFCIADRVIATAAHVVGRRTAADLSFVTASGIRFEVERVQVEPTIDAAVLWLPRSLAYEPPVGHAHQQADWQVTARPEPAAVQLSGTVTAVDHLMTNTGGHEMTVLQLEVRQELKDFGGYSGGAVVMNSVVVGILVEQVEERVVAAAGVPVRAANVLYAVPISRVLKKFRLGDRALSRQPALPAHRLVDTAYFDMDTVKSAILAVIDGRADRSLAFGLPDVDMKVVDNLAAWLPSYIGQVAPKSQFAMRAEIGSMDAWERYVTRYLPDLDRRNVICPVLVDGVDTELVAELWKRIRTACTHGRQRLIIFFVGRPSAGFPDGIDQLPSPSVRHQDIAEWAQLVVTARRWPRSLAGPWTAQIVEQSSLDDRLDLRMTYETLEHYFDLLRTEPDDLRRHLEELETSC
ncbi:serine protease [Actinoplanes sp. NBC_00393]|uniref:S1 family peptidase n=1 Tax=Actinoplanes sp. NBC_00393 TaxID=2975953 RepID=UPI002E1BEE6A